MAMLAALERAFADEAPGPPLPPGPRTNDWRAAGALAIDGRSREADLLDELWRPRGVHVRPDGTPTSVPQRLVPSAGGAYPVQWHVLVPSGADASLPPGRWVRDETGLLLRRSGPPPSGHSVSIVLTVQPGRTFGRYRHRAWPLWVADAAYALEAVRALVPAAQLPRAWADLADVRRRLGVPPAGEAAWWLDRGLVPELCLARIELPAGWVVDGAVARALGTRRSPALSAYAVGTPTASVAAEAALQSGQAWVRGATRVLAWPFPTEPLTSPAAYRFLWQAHRQAARLCYRLVRDGIGSRPVSGFTAPPGAGASPLLHALALLDPQDRR